MSTLSLRDRDPGAPARPDAARRDGAARPSRLLGLALVLAASLAAQDAGDFESFPEEAPATDSAGFTYGGDAEGGLVAGAAGRTSKDERDLILTPLPLLPPERANEKFDSTFSIARTNVEGFLLLLGEKPFLDINVLIATNAPQLEDEVNLVLDDITVGEAFALVLQLNGLKAVRFNANTLIILEENDARTFGVKRRKVYRLTYTSTEAVVEFITNNPNLNGLLDLENIIQDDNNNSLLIIDSPDRILVLDHVISLLDAKPNKITARIPLSHVDLDDVTTAIGNMPAEVRSRLNTEEMIYSERGRTLIVHDTPEDVALLRDIIRQIDIGLKQVLIDVSIMEVTETLARNIGLSLRTSQLEVSSIDKIWNLDRLRADLVDGNPVTNTRLTYELQKQGGQTIANPKIRVVDQESATITIGQIRNVRVQTSQFSNNQVGNTAQTTFNTQEVPVGVTLTAEPEIHNDGTVTLRLGIQDEEIISISEFGVDRTTRNSDTVLRIRDGETVIIGGFINRNVSYDKTPIPILGQLPLLNKLFRNNARSKLASELIILLTPYILDYDPVMPRTEVEVVPPGRPIKVKNYGYSDETVKRDVKTTSTRWVETADERTKIIYDAMGEVIYQRSFPREGAAGADAATPPRLGPPAAGSAPGPRPADPPPLRNSGAPPEAAVEDWGGLMREMSDLAGG